MFFAIYDERRGWRVRADYRSIGGDVIDICGAINQLVAMQTAVLMSEFRKDVR